MTFLKQLFVWIKYLLLIALAIYFLSGFYRIKPNEIALLHRFGKIINDNVTPGLHYALPKPFFRVDKVKVKEMKRAAIGFELVDAIVPRSTVSRQGEFLTGDENIIEVQLVMQYYILNPRIYISRIDQPSQFIRSVAKSYLTNMLATFPVDKIFEGKGQTLLQHEVKEKTQKKLDSLMPNIERWVKITSVNLQNPPSPPVEVADAFKAVATARQDRGRLIREAEGYRNDVLPKVKGKAEEIIQQAIAYKIEKINQAQGDTTRFVDMADEYDKQKNVTSTRLYLETMERVMSKIQKIIVPNEMNNEDLNIRLIGLQK